MADRMQRDLADRELGRALGREITRLRRHVRELEIASQGAFRSVEDGAIDVYDDDGVLRERIGKQTDGTYGRKSFTGDPPPAPTEPDVVVISDGVVAVSWDGRFEERYGGDFRNVQIHLGDTATFTPTRNTQEGAIFARRGGTVVCVTESDDDNPVWVRLVATNRAGEAGPPSDAALVDEDDLDGLDDEDEEVEWEDGDGHTLTAADITAGTVTFGLSFIPEQESLLAWWHPGGLGFAGVPQTRGASFTVDYETRSVTWPLSGFEKAGDRLRVYYAHVDGPPAAPEWPLAAAWITRSGGNMTIHVRWAIPPVAATSMALTLYTGSTQRLSWSFNASAPNVPAGATETTFEWTDIPDIDGLHVGIGYSTGSVEGSDSPAYNKPFAWNNPAAGIYWFGAKSYDNGDPNDQTDEPFAPIGA